MLILAFIAQSCSNTRRAVYFNNIREGVIQDTMGDLEPVIQKNDLLSISVSSLNPDASALFNTPNAQAASTNSASGNVIQASGYLVNQDGNIQFPILGSIHALGLKKKDLTDLITKDLIDNKLLTDPIVTIRFLNFRVTVLGEVSKPSVITVPNEKISVMEAIGLAGDLTIYARKDNVLLIREQNGHKTIKRLNLNKDDILRSPFYNLQSNDLIYVEPNKTKIRSGRTSPELLPVLLGITTLLIVILSNPNIKL